MAPQKPGASAVKNRKTRKKTVARKNPPTGKPGKTSSLPSPSNLISLDSLNNLRKNAKQWLNYLQQADVFLDTIYSAGNQLNETGVLQKIIKQKGKNLSTGDFTAILMALMNTPLADRFFKGGKQESNSANTPSESQSGSANPSTNESPSPAQLPPASSPGQPEPSEQPPSPAPGQNQSQQRPSPWGSPYPIPGYGQQPYPFPSPGHGPHSSPYPGIGGWSAPQPGFGYPGHPVQQGQPGYGTPAPPVQQAQPGNGIPGSGFHHGPPYLLQ